MNIEPEEAPAPLQENAVKVDIHAPLKSAQSTADGILKNLKSQLQKYQTGENAEEHFLRELP